MAALDVVQKIQREVLIDKYAPKFKNGHGKPNSESIPVTFGGNPDAKERKRYFRYSEAMEFPSSFVNHPKEEHSYSENVRYLIKYFSIKFCYMGIHFLIQQNVSGFDVSVINCRLDAIVQINFIVWLDIIVKKMLFCIPNFFYPYLFFMKFVMDD